MLENSTDGVRRSVFWARYFAGKYGAESIEPVHLHLGLLLSDPELMHRVLRRPESADQLRAELESSLKRGQRAPLNVEIPLDGQSEDILKYAANAATRLHQKYCTAVHLFLAVLKRSDLPAGAALDKYCVPAEELERVIEEHREN